LCLIPPAQTRVIFMTQKIKTNDIQFQQDGIQYIFLPHVPRTVTQSIKTFVNLYKGIGLATRL